MTSINNKSKNQAPEKSSVTINKLSAFRVIREHRVTAHKARLQNRFPVHLTLFAWAV